MAPVASARDFGPLERERGEPLPTPEETPDEEEETPDEEEDTDEEDEDDEFFRWALESRSPMMIPPFFVSISGTLSSEKSRGMRVPESECVMLRGRLHCLITKCIFFSLHRRHAPLFWSL